MQSNFEHEQIEDQEHKKNHKIDLDGEEEQDQEWEGDDEVNLCHKMCHTMS